MKENKNLFIGLGFVIIVLFVLIYFAFFNNSDEKKDIELKSFSYTVEGMDKKSIDFDIEKKENDIQIVILEDTVISKDISFEIDVNVEYNISKLVDDELKQELILKLNPDKKDEVKYVFNIEFKIEENILIEEAEKKYGVSIKYYDDKNTKCKDLNNCIIEKIEYTKNIDSNFDEYEVSFSDFRDKKEELVQEVCKNSIKCSLKIKDKKIDNKEISLNYIMLDTFLNFKLYNIKIGNSASLLFHEKYDFLDDINIYENNFAIVFVKSVPSKSGAPTSDKDMFLFNSSAKEIYSLKENDIKLNSDNLTYNEFNEFDKKIFDQIVEGFDKNTIIGYRYKLDYNNNSFSNKTKLMDLKIEDI